MSRPDIHIFAVAEDRASYRSFVPRDHSRQRTESQPSPGWARARLASTGAEEEGRPGRDVTVRREEKTLREEDKRVRREDNTVI